MTSVPPPVDSLSFYPVQKSPVTSPPLESDLHADAAPVRRKIGTRREIGEIGTDTSIVTIRGVYGHDRAYYGLAEPLHSATRIM